MPSLTLNRDDYLVGFDPFTSIAPTFHRPMLLDLGAVNYSQRTASIGDSGEAEISVRMDSMSLEFDGDVNIEQRHPDRKDARLSVSMSVPLHYETTIDQSRYSSPVALYKGEVSATLRVGKSCDSDIQQWALDTAKEITSRAVAKMVGGATKAYFLEEYPIDKLSMKMAEVLHQTQDYYERKDQQARWSPNPRWEAEFDSRATITQRLHTKPKEPKVNKPKYVEGQGLW